MDKAEIDPRIVEQIKKLEEKYEAMGQDLSSYLDGLLHSDYLTYWDYVHLDTLLSLQTPKTSLPDEMIFISYHQHTEIFFKLILWEIDQLSKKVNITEDFFLERLSRIIRYFKILENSFSVMIEGMEREQFLKFRMSLLPASGFQSAQYRMIEIASTDLYQLVDAEYRDQLSPEDSLEKLMEKIYWKRGATELASGKKTLTLEQFEHKYSDDLIQQARDFKNCNIRRIYQNNFPEAGRKEEIVKLLRQYDLVSNVFWPLTHYKSAVKYLHRDPDDIAATGGTNWQKFLPPRFQRIIYFPELWSAQELSDWGKPWVMKEVFHQ